MAKKVETPPPGFGDRSPESQYLKFFDGSVWLIEASDFPDRHLNSVRSSIVMSQRRVDPTKKVVTRLDNDGLYVQSVDRKS